LRLQSYEKFFKYANGGSRFWEKWGGIVKNLMGRGKMGGEIRGKLKKWVGRTDVQIRICTERTEKFRGHKNTTEMQNTGR